MADDKSNNSSSQNSDDEEEDEELSGELREHFGEPGSERAKMMSLAARRRIWFEDLRGLPHDIFEPEDER